MSTAWILVHPHRIVEPQIQPTNSEGSKRGASVESVGGRRNRPVSQLVAISQIDQ